MTTEDLNEVPSETELDTFDPENTTVTLQEGFTVEIQDLKTRQFFKLLRIITRGTGPLMSEMSLSGTDSTDEFVGKLVAMVLFAIPEAEDETIDFLLSMVEPVGLRKGRRLSDEDKEFNTQLYESLLSVLDNPVLEDLVTLLEVIVKREAADIQSLGKRLQKMFSLAGKTGQLPTARS